MLKDQTDKTRRGEKMYFIYKKDQLLKA